VVTEAYPRDRHHGWKFIAFGPDGWLYVPVGAHAMSAAVTRDTPHHASGPWLRPGRLREWCNTVGFDWHPATKGCGSPTTADMWATTPPDELNVAAGAALVPFCHAARSRTRRQQRPCSLRARTPSTWHPRHAFLHKTMFRRVLEPDLHRRTRVVEPAPCYRVMKITSPQRVTGYEPFDGCG
jgi:glucose/arabinose dehydrogenase